MVYKYINFWNLLARKRYFSAVLVKRIDIFSFCEERVNIFTGDLSTKIRARTKRKERIQRINLLQISKRELNMSCPFLHGNSLYKNVQDSLDNCAKIKIFMFFWNIRSFRIEAYYRSINLGGFFVLFLIIIDKDR